MSAESGLKTFRDTNGLWEGYDVMDIASPMGFEKNPELVLEFYNHRRKQLKEVKPNQGHINLKQLEQYYDVNIVTQNVDNLHERAGSSDILHLHGELNKVRSLVDKNIIFDWTEDLFLGDVDSNGNQLRPHIVWFGEDVSLFDKAIKITEKADILVIIGTSMQVYPAANLIHYIKDNTPVYFIDPKPNISNTNNKNLTIIPKTAIEGTTELIKLLTD